MHSGNAMGVALPSDDDPSTDRGLQMPGETRVLGVASAVLGSGSRVCRVGIRQSRLPCWDPAVASAVLGYCRMRFWPEHWFVNPALQSLLAFYELLSR